MKKTMRFLLAAVALVFGMTSCDEFKSFVDNPVNSYLEVDTVLYVKEGATIDLYAETISDAVVTYTVGDEKIAKVEKVDNKHAKVTGVKPGMTVIKVQLAANDAYAGGEATVKVNVTPAVTLADAVKDGAKLQIGCKFNGEDCLLAYEFDASAKKFNLIYKDCVVPEAFVNYVLANYYDEEMGKIAYKVTYKGDDLFELNLYTAGSYDRIFRVPVEMKSIQVNNYDVLPYTEESVTPIQSLTPAGLPANMSTGATGSFAVIGVTPLNATNQVIKYSSSNTAVMTIDANGNFEAVGVGEATLKAEATDGSGKFVEQSVTVTEGNTYLKWNADQKKLETTDIPEGAIVVTPSTVSTGANLVCNGAATFVIAGQVTLGTITLKANVNLIIKDNAKLTANKIVGDGDNINLYIYGQTKKTGELVVNCSGTDAISDLSTLEVHSAKVTATSSASVCGGFFNIGTFNVYGGLVDAKCTAADEGFGIGLKAGGSLNIWGGEVKAEGKGDSALCGYGITCGASEQITTVKVYGGKLLAWNASNQALNSSITLVKGTGFSGQIYTSSNGSSWDVYTGTATPDSKYVWGN